MSDKPAADWNPARDLPARDQASVYDELRQRCPVAYSEELGWSVLRHADVLSVLQDPQTFSNVVSEHRSVPNGMDPPDHTAYRKLIEPYFEPERVAAFEPACREIAGELVRWAVMRSEAVEVMGQLATRFAARAQCAFLGWLPELHESLIDWVGRNQSAVQANDRAELKTLADEFEAIVADQASHRAVAPPPQGGYADAFGLLVQERIDGQLSIAELTSICRTWTVGEIGTIAASIGILLHYLAHDQTFQQRLRDDLTLVPPAIDEILRTRNPLLSNRRVAKCPVELGGRTIQQGERVTVNWVSANRDEQAFDAPDQVRLDRDPSKNLLYGAGIHACPGAPLARMELRVFVEELLLRAASLELPTNSTTAPAAAPVSGYAQVHVHLKPSEAGYGS